jgi:hypothetical protein
MIYYTKFNVFDLPMNARLLLIVAQPRMLAFGTLRLICDHYHVAPYTFFSANGRPLPPGSIFGVCNSDVAVTVIILPLSSHASVLSRLSSPQYFVVDFR